MAYFRCCGPLPDAHKTLVGIAAFASHWPIDSSHSGSTAQEPWLDLQIAIGVGEGKIDCGSESVLPDPKHPTVKNCQADDELTACRLGFAKEDRRIEPRLASTTDTRPPIALIKNPISEPLIVKLETFSRDIQR